MMRNRIKQCGTALMAVALVLLLVAPTMTTQGQVKPKDGNMAKAAPWLDEKTKLQLNQIEQWQQWEASYQESNHKLKKLNDSILGLEKEKLSRVKRQNHLQGQLAVMLNETLNNQSYAQYDLTILGLQKNHYDNPTIEQQAAALLICREAEKALTVRYNNTTVTKALKNIDEVKTSVRPVASNISGRLNKYEAMSTDLKNALIAVTSDTILKTPSSSATQNTKKQYLKQFFKEVEKRIDPVLLNPNEYPYLYKVLMEALNTKRNDPCSDINSIIKKL